MLKLDILCGFAVGDVIMTSHLSG